MEAKQVPTTKQKTKAKQRYLKRKKERRRIRPQTATKPTAETDSEVDDEPSTGEKSPQHSESPKPPKKRRRHDTPDEPADETPELVDPPVDVDVEMAGPEQLPEDLPALPSFPLPELPDAPSKAVLALQGLDKGLVDAEVVSQATVLPLSEGRQLSERMIRRLKENGISELFAVQTALLPFLLLEGAVNPLYTPYEPPRDVCVSAPTGSGKTLAYAVPIVETLSRRIVTRLRALVVVPTRDLVNQVRELFEALCKGSGLKIGTATGAHSFVHEQSQLIHDQTTSLQGGSSKVDILICTPGRLIDHLNGTPNFSLQHLRFLVIDEADRLLAQSFQGWLGQVLQATRPDTSSSKRTSEGPVADAVAPNFISDLSFPVIPSFLTETTATSCQKLLFSATLTRDPGKISALGLRNPKYFIVQGKETAPGDDVLNVVMEKFSMPSTLTENMTVCESSRKPLVFFHLVQQFQMNNALVFTKSAESTTRLVRLFQFFAEAMAAQDKPMPFVIRAYSSDLPSNERKTILEQLKNQEIHILVCSDLISRGIDISHVSHVINYDAPVDVRKYVHRVGRTARAGRSGTSWTLLEEQEARYFKGMMKEIDHLESIQKVKVTEDALKALQPIYEDALGKLKTAYSRQTVY